MTVVEALPQIMANVLDPEMADYARKQLVKAGIRVLTGTTASKFAGEGKVQSRGDERRHAAGRCGRALRGREAEHRLLKRHRT